MYELQPIRDRETHRVAEILNRKHPLTLKMIRRLHEQLGIPTQTLIQPYSLASA